MNSLSSTEAEYVVDKEFSESGLEEAVNLAAARFAEAMKLYDEASQLPKWDKTRMQSLQSTAGRLVADTTLIGYVLDNVVPLSGGLHWFDQIQAEVYTQRQPEAG